jgi:hypothetical protein
MIRSEMKRPRPSPSRPSERPFDVSPRENGSKRDGSRWTSAFAAVLMMLDRLRGTEIVMTQELLANMLGVRREGVTERVLKLRRAGLTRYARGSISILDRAAREHRACECYSVVKREYERLLPRRPTG